MTPQQINITIAELCGWINKPCSPKDNCYGVVMNKWYNPKGEVEPVPPYTTHLDACAEFERTLINEQKHQEYAMTLHLVVRVKTNTELENWWLHITATPLQRCEAFLRLHGKWEE